MEQEKSRKTFSDKAIKYFENIRSPLLPESHGVDILNPYRDRSTLDCVRKFYSKFYSNSDERIFSFGINPGRFGAGITGINFTDPVALQEFCGIENSLDKRRELSSVFIYDFINSMGGPEEFFDKHYISAVSPLGFVKDGKNFNYYDNRDFMNDLTPFIVESIRAQLEFGARRDFAVIIGTGKNAKFMEELNEKNGFFKKLVMVEHPRFIMQYRRKRMDEYLAKYVDIFSSG